MISRSYKRTLLLSGLFFVIVFYMLATQSRLKKFEGKVMGTTYHVSYFGTWLSSPVKQVSQEVFNALNAVDMSMSTYREQSELMAFNRWPLNKPMTASPGLVNLIKESQTVSVLSKGAYDVTVGPLVNLWGFGPPPQDSKAAKEEKNKDASNHIVRAPEFIQWQLNDRSGKVPSENAIRKARKRVGYQYVIADTAHNTLTRTHPVFVDLSSIAKGYGVDQAARTLKKAGIKNYMVEVGGEVFASGKKPDGSEWRLAISSPNLDNTKPRAIVQLNNKGMATSGDYLNFFVVNGKHYAHTINPTTGWPDTNRLVEVAVIRNTVAEADALATMFMVLGDQKGLKLANNKGIAAYFTYRDGNGLKSVASEAFQPYIVH